MFEVKLHANQNLSNHFDSLNTGCLLGDLGKVALPNYLEHMVVHLQIYQMSLQIVQRF